MEAKDFKAEFLLNYFECSASYGFSSSKKTVYPVSYLDFAKADLNVNSSRRNRVNAVSNAKRAFHFQVEMLCDVFSWHTFNHKNIVPFPKKLEYLEQCGVLSPNILRKLNRIRNQIEHDYHIPAIEDVEDYIDIVELFLMATKNLLYQFPEELEYELMEDDQYDTSLNLPQNIQVTIKMNEGGIGIKFESETISRAVSDKDYFEWLSAIITQHMF